MDRILLVAMCMTILVVQEYFHRMERKDLYNRIMAGSLREYQEGTSQKASKPPKGNPIKKTLDKQYDLRER
jgi:hypothetical protein